MSVINARSFGRFWPISWTITHCFGVPDGFPRLTKPRVRLNVGHQHSRFLSILIRFMDYYLPFWGPKAISTVVEPQGALTCRSSTIVVLADSGPFLGLLLSYGVPERFPQLRNTGVRLRVGHEHSQFWPILARFVDYHSLFWGPGVISTLDEHRRAFTCRS